MAYQLDDRDQQKYNCEDPFKITFLLRNTYESFKDFHLYDVDFVFMYIFVPHIQLSLNGPKYLIFDYIVCQPSHIQCFVKIVLQLIFNRGSVLVPAALKITYSCVDLFSIYRAAACDVRQA